MKNLFGEESEWPQKKRKPQDKARRAWENAFQRWCNQQMQDESTPYGCCGFGRICGYCTENDKGRPCVRALNAWAREKRVEIDYSDRDFVRWFGA